MHSFKFNSAALKAVPRSSTAGKKASIAADRSATRPDWSRLQIETDQAALPLESVDSSSTAVQVVKENGILTLSLNRPAVLNAIDLQMAQTLLVQLKRAATDTSVRALIITGKGRAFCAGGDLKFALQANPQQPGNSFLALTSILHESIEQITKMPKPVVAVVNGPAAGAGLFLALACDLRLMAETAYLKLSNPSYGLSLPAGGTFLLPRIVGMGRALEMVLLDQPIAAHAAQALGLVTRVVPDQTLPAEAAALVQQLSKRAVHTLGQVKKLLYASFTRSLGEQLAAEQEAMVESANHAEGREGLAAFLEKRSPNYEKLNLPNLSALSERVS